MTKDAAVGSPLTAKPKTSQRSSTPMSLPPRSVCFERDQSVPATLRIERTMPLAGVPRNEMTET